MQIEAYLEGKEEVASVELCALQLVSPMWSWSHNRVLGAEPGIFPKT